MYNNIYIEQLSKGERSRVKHVIISVSASVFVEGIITTHNWAKNHRYHPQGQPTAQTTVGGIDKHEQSKSACMGGLGGVAGHCVRG